MSRVDCIADGLLSAFLLAFPRLEFTDVVFCEFVGLNYILD